MGIDVMNQVKAYETNGAECKTLERPELMVRSHWNRREMVELVWPDGSRLTVSSRDLQAAIQNATNSGR